MIPAMTTDSQPRSVKIGTDERPGWSSERPRRTGDRPARPANVTVRNRVLRPTEELRYSPGSLLIVVSPSKRDRDAFIKRTVIEAQSAVLSLDRVRALLDGKVAADQLEEQAARLLDAAVAKRAGEEQTVVLAADSLDAGERERAVRIAARTRRPRHLILLEASNDEVTDEDRPALNALRKALDTGALGAEGFHTALRLGGSSASEVKRILFRPEPRDD
jgi:hypothetical protein